jgi:cobalt-zinc-cadmium efflux system membrane fusion protein
LGENAFVIQESARAAWDYARSHRALTLVVLGAVVALALVFSSKARFSAEPERPNGKPASENGLRTFTPTPAQWASFQIEPVGKRAFHTEIVTEGKISVDEERATPIFSPYSGRITRLLAKPGEMVQRGQPLFMLDVADMVQGQNDFIAAATALNKARSQLELARLTEKRQHDLYEGKATPLKELQQAQAALVAAQNDLRSAEVAFEAMRNRLRLLGRNDEEIAVFQNRGEINPETPIYAPIAGTIVQRKVGPGQYVASGASDPVFVIGDLSRVWLIAYGREADAQKLKVGEVLSFQVLAYPDRVFKTKVEYVAAAVDPATHRILVRASVDNAENLLKPEMFATVTIFSGDGEPSPAVPRQAIIYQDDTARVWVARDDKTLESRPIRLGLVNDSTVQVVAGLEGGERVVTKGYLFIERASGN